MEYIIIIILSIITIICLKFIFGINIKKIKQMSKESQLDELTTRLPGNKKLCENMLKIIKNEDVKIKKSQDEKSGTSLYLVMTNTISIANFKNNYARVQTIAHECMHSIQNKKMLWFNFIFSNLYIWYFIITAILIAFKIIPDSLIFLGILFVSSIIFYSVRSYLETDAMTKAKYLAKEYLEKTNLYSKEEITELVDSYEKINAQAIPFVNYSLVCKILIKIIIYCVIYLVI